MPVTTESGVPESPEMQPTPRGFANIQEAWADFQRRCPEFEGVELPSSGPSTCDTQETLIEEANVPQITGRPDSRKWGWLTWIAACLILSGVIGLRYRNKLMRISKKNSQYYGKQELDLLLFFDIKQTPLTYDVKFSRASPPGALTGCSFLCGVVTLYKEL